MLSLPTAQKLFQRLGVSELCRTVEQVVTCAKLD